MSEILAGIRVIKFYAWENNFIKKILGYRYMYLHTHVDIDSIWKVFLLILRKIKLKCSLPHVMYLNGWWVQIL